MEKEKTIDQLLESLDNEVFSPDMKVQMKNTWNKKLESLVEEKSEEFNKQIEESSKNYDEKIKTLSEEFEKSQTQELNEFKTNVVETLDTFLTRLSEEIVEKNTQNILEKTIVNEAVEIHKVFDQLMEQYHFGFVNAPKTVEKVQIDESLKSELNKAVNEISDLKKAVALAEEKDYKNQKKLIIMEYSSRLDSVVDKHRFNVLAESFVFIPNEKEIFEKRLETLLSTVGQRKTEEPIKESVQKEIPKAKNVLREGLDEKTGTVINEEEVTGSALTAKLLKKQIEKY